jgi:hypothetical protein
VEGKDIIGSRNGGVHKLCWWSWDSSWIRRSSDCGCWGL